jgi:uncharacterized RDD family membrane protein YckC
MSEQGVPEAQTSQPAPPEWQPEGPSGPRASFGRRFVAYLIDVILLAIVGGVLTAFMSREAANAISFLVGLAYFGFFEGGSSGQTLGKKALGIRVIDFSAGGPIGYGRGVIRYLARILSTIPLLLGYFWMLWDKEKQTWHDKLATSVVVPEKFYPLR